VDGCPLARPVMVAVDVVPERQQPLEAISFSVVLLV
jgi:hypothetical protein